MVSLVIGVVDGVEGVEDDHVRVPGPQGGQDAGVHFVVEGVEVGP